MNTLYWTENWIRHIRWKWIRRIQLSTRTVYLRKIIKYDQLCSVVSSIPHSFAAITERPSHSSSMGPSRKRSRSPTTSVSISSPIPGALSPARANLLPPPKRIRSFDSVTNLEDCSDESSESSVPRENSLRDDIVIRGSDEPYSEPDIDPAIQAEIDEYIAYVDALRAEGIDARVVVETVAREEVKTSVKGPVEVMVDRVIHPAVSGDIPKPAQEEGAIEGIYEMLGDLDCSNGSIEYCFVGEDQIMPNIRSGATMTREVVNELIDRRVAEAFKARDAARNLEPLVEGRGEQEDEDGDDYEGGNGGGNINGRVNGNGGNGNGENGNGGVNGNRNGRGNGNGNDNGNVNGNEGGNGYNFGGFMHVARECTYQDFLKCQPLNFNGTEGVVGLTRLFEKMETMFHISNCPQKYQLMTEVYFSRNEIQKMEAELWNLTVKGNDLTPYIRRFQELVLLCTRMVPDKEDKVERFIWGLPHNIQGNVIVVEPTRLQDAIRIASKLTDQKLKGYARSAKNKRRFDNNSRENRG
ncbi:putative reverse transcriptase domain-containing protein [Tanacetum coccineum]